MLRKNFLATLAHELLRLKGILTLTLFPLGHLQVTVLPRKELLLRLLELLTGPRSQLLVKHARRRGLPIESGTEGALRHLLLNLLGFVLLHVLVHDEVVLLACLFHAFGRLLIYLSESSLVLVVRLVLDAVPAIFVGVER